MFRREPAAASGSSRTSRHRGRRWLARVRWEAYTFRDPSPSQQPAAPTSRAASVGGVAERELAAHRIAASGRPYSPARRISACVDRDAYTPRLGIKITLEPSSRGGPLLDPDLHVPGDLRSTDEKILSGAPAPIYDGQSHNMFVASLPRPEELLPRRLRQRRRTSASTDPHPVAASRRETSWRIYSHRRSPRYDRGPAAVPGTTFRPWMRRPDHRNLPRPSDILDAFYCRGEAELQRGLGRRNLPARSGSTPFRPRATPRCVLRSVTQHGSEPRLAPEAGRKDFTILSRAVATLAPLSVRLAGSAACRCCWRWPARRRAGADLAAGGPRLRHRPPQVRRRRRLVRGPHLAREPAAPRARAHHDPGGRASRRRSSSRARRRCSSTRSCSPAVTGTSSSPRPRSRTCGAT